MEEVRDAHGFLTKAVMQLKRYLGHNHKVIGNAEDGKVSVIAKTKSKVLSAQGLGRRGSFKVSLETSDKGFGSRDVR